jgi:hypothetical protein
MTAGGFASIRIHTNKCDSQPIGNTAMLVYELRVTHLRRQQWKQEDAELIAEGLMKKIVQLCPNHEHRMFNLGQA